MSSLRFSRSNETTPRISGPAFILPAWLPVPRSMNDLRCRTGMSSAFWIGHSAACAARSTLVERSVATTSTCQPESGEQRHRQRVRLLAGGAGGAPGAHAPRLTGVGLGLQHREHAFVEELKLAAVAEELRLVRADAVEHP